MIPTITLVNEATVDAGVSMPRLKAALQLQMIDFRRYWNLMCFIVLDKQVRPGTWGLLMLDDADQANALGYHDVTADGLPVGKVFVKTALQYGEKPSVTASHELCEMLADPAINLCASTNSDNLIYAYEVCDPVEDRTYDIGGVTVSDFVTPEWFEDFHKPGAVRCSRLGSVTAPFTLTSGGYMPVFANGNWTQIFGSQQKKSAFGREDRRDHRSEIRAAKRPIMSAMTEARLPQDGVSCRVQP